MPKPTSNRGNTKAALNQHEDAIADHNEAIRLNPDYAIAYNNRGGVKAVLNRHEPPTSAMVTLRAT